MRVFFLVLLLILNAFADAQSSGSARSPSQFQKVKTAVLAKKASPKSASKTKKVKTSKPAKPNSTASFEATQATPTVETPISKNADTSHVKPQNNVVVVRDTVVDTVYVTSPDTVESRQSKDCYNIPLPHQSAFLGKGFSVGIGAGLFNASKDCDCLGVWQGQLEFHYKDYITGGFDVRFFGGTLDRDVMLLYQRYRLNVRFHKSFSGADFYISPLLGLETTDLSEFRKELREGVHKNRSDSNSVAAQITEGTASNGALSREFESLDGIIADRDGDSIGVSQNEKNCEKMFSLDGFTLGLEAGLGLVVNRYIGILGSASYEFNFSWTQLVAFTPGIAFNLHEVWPWANKNLKSTWVSFEMVFQRYFNRNVKEWAVAGFLGLQFGI